MNDIKTLDMKNSGIPLINQYETFILVEGTKHYYVSSEGRLANDSKGKIYLHSSKAPQKAKKLHWKIYYENGEGSSLHRDVNADDLVAETFLEKIQGKDKVYHIDGDISNNKYNIQMITVKLQKIIPMQFMTGLMHWLILN